MWPSISSEVLSSRAGTQPTSGQDTVPYLRFPDFYPNCCINLMFLPTKACGWVLGKVGCVYIPLLRTEAGGFHDSSQPELPNEALSQISKGLRPKTVISIISRPQPWQIWVNRRYIESDTLRMKEIFTLKSFILIHLFTRENRFRRVRSRLLQVTRNAEENLLIFTWWKYLE